MLYHQDPKVPPDWINEELDKELHAIIEELSEANCTSIECDASDHERRYLHHELEMLNYITIEEDELAKEQYLVSALEEGRTYRKRQSDYNAEVEYKKYLDQQERKERAAREQAERDQAQAERDHQMAMKRLEVLPKTFVSALAPLAAFVAVLAGVFAGFHLDEGVKAGLFVALGFAFGLLSGALIWRVGRSSQYVRHGE